MNRYLAIKGVGTEAYVVDTQSPGDSADGAIVATCRDISNAVGLAAELND